MCVYLYNIYKYDDVSNSSHGKMYQNNIIMYYYNDNKVFI